jgi:hypothetical protein
MYRPPMLSNSDMAASLRLACRQFNRRYRGNAKLAKHDTRIEHEKMEWQRGMTCWTRRRLGHAMTTEPADVTVIYSKALYFLPKGAFTRNCRYPGGLRGCQQLPEAPGFDGFMEGRDFPTRRHSVTGSEDRTWLEITPFCKRAKDLA